MTKVKLTKKDLMATFWRFVAMNMVGWSYERYMGPGYCFAILPILKKTRPDPEEFKEAFATNLNFFVTSPIIGYPLILGVHAALEEAGASLETTEGFKVAMMGPLAGVGDSLTFALWNSLIYSIGSVLALQGNLFGPIFALVMIFFPYLIIRYWQFMWGYKQGTKVISQLAGGTLQKITEISSIVGLMVIGGFAPGIIKLTTALAWSGNATVQGEEVVQTVALQGYLDQVLPYMLPMTALVLAYWLLGKGWTPIKVLLVLVVIGFVGGALGIWG
jgi:mannose/fructose/N-acetylgalactosamine-specific phosphotransferase system component IID